MLLYFFTFGLYEVNYTEASRKLNKLCVLTTAEPIATILPAELIWAPGGLGCCPFCGGGSLIVDSLFTVVPVVFVGWGVGFGPFLLGNT